MNSLYVVSGSANPGLAQAVSDQLDTPLQPMEKLGHFSDGELRVQFGEGLRGRHVFITQPTCPPVDMHLMQLLLMIDAAKRASASSVSAVMPYFGYARQDRKDRPHTPISAALVCKLLKTAGADRILALDLHSGQIQGFFDGPFDNISMMGVLLRHFHGQVDWKKVTLMSPDATGAVRCQEAANHLGCTVGFVRKYRPEANVSEAMEVVGDTDGRIVIFLDDMSDTMGTLATAAKLVAERGASKIFAACTHGVLSGNAIKRLQDSPIEMLVISDTVPIPDEKRTAKIQVVSAAQTLGRMIHRVHQGGSLSLMVDNSFNWAKTLNS